MKIFHITPRYPPSLGGTEKVVEAIATFQSKENEVTVITSKTKKNYKQNINILIKRLHKFDFAHTTIIPSLLYNLLLIPSKSIFHIHIGQAFVPEIAWIAGKIKKQKIIFHFHLDVQSSGFFGFLLIPYKKIILKFILNYSDKIICLNKSGYKILQNYYNIPSHKLIIISNGINEIFYQKRKKKFKKLINVLFIGRLVKQKNPTLLIHMLPLLKHDVHLTIVGDGELKQELQSLIQQKKLTNVTLMGQVQYENLPKLYKESDMLIMPSINEGMPLVALEAMASGLPIICSNIPELKETCGEAAIYAQHNSANIYASIIDNTISHPEKLEAMSIKGFNRALPLRWENQVNKIINVYKDLEKYE